MTGEALTDTQLSILAALARYRLLTAKQLHDAGVCKHPRYVHQVLGELCPKEREPSPASRPKRRNLPIDYLEFGSHPSGRGSRADIWHLTRAGAKLLAEARGDLEPLKVPDKVEPYHNEYEHRCHTVDFHIALDRFAALNGFNVDFVHTYFGRGDERYQTRVSYQRAGRDAVIVPDAVFQLRSARGAALVAFEMYEGRRTERATERLLAYLEVIHQEAIEQAFGFGEASVQVAAVFDTVLGERLVRARLAKSPEFSPFSELFFFKTIAEVQTDFRHGWRQAGGVSAALF